MGSSRLRLQLIPASSAVFAPHAKQLLGLLMAFRYSPSPPWPHRRFNYFRFHNWTRYIALAVSFPSNDFASLTKIRTSASATSLPSNHLLSHSITPSCHRSLSARIFVVTILACRIRLGRHLWKPSTSLFYFRSRRAFSGTAYSPSRLKCLRRLVRWRQTLGRLLPAPHRRPHPAALAPHARKKPCAPAKSLSQQPAPLLNILLKKPCLRVDLFNLPPVSGMSLLTSPPPFFR